jgi:hydroxypyruvate isomerase
MHRRQFLGAAAAAACSTSTLAHSLAPVNAPNLAPPESGGLPEATPFPLSIMLWTVYRDLPFEQRLEKVSEAGYHAAELVGEFKEWSPEDFARYRKKKESLSITFDATSGVKSGLCDPAERDTLLKELQSILVVMGDLQCDKLILLSGNRVEGLSHAQMRANCVESIKFAADLAAKKNIELLIENIDPEENPKYFLTSVAEGFDIVREVGQPNVKFLYDFFHEQIAEGNLIEKLEKNIDLVGLVHIADVPGRHEPGTGEINYGNIFRKLHELKYRHYAAMEFIPTRDPIQSLRAARELVAASV